MTASTPKPTFQSRVAYKDRRGAVEWLEKAFGFKTTMLATDSDGSVVYAEVRFGNGQIHIGSEWENAKAPGSVGGANTQTISVQLEDGIDAHCERARAAGTRFQQTMNGPGQEARRFAQSFRRAASRRAQFTFHFLGP